MAVSKIRIKLKAYDHEVIDKTARSIVDTAERTGFDFHTIDGARYWDERAYYRFTLAEIERDLEAPTGELEAMCRELVARAIADERMMKILRIPVPYWNWIATSFKRGDPSL